MARLPFDPSKLSLDDLTLYRRIIERRKAKGAGFGGPYAALMNHPKLCAKIEALGFYLKFEGHLPRNIYQFVVLCVARHTGAAFEWVDHLKHAQAAGLPLTVIRALQKDGLGNAKFGAPYDLIARVLAATLNWKNIPADVQQQGIRQFGVEGFIEIVVLSGLYQMFAAINQGFDVPLPPGIPRPF